MWYWELLAILLLTKKINQTSKLVEADEADLATSSNKAEAPSPVMQMPLVWWPAPGEAGHSCNSGWMPTATARGASPQQQPWEVSTAFKTEELEAQPCISTSVN
jgi:hypothetical protein